MEDVGKIASPARFRYNPSNELDGQRFRVKNISTENDPSGGVGWVLIAMDGNVKCNIGRNKSGIRNTKNQNFGFSECRSEKNVTLPQAKIFSLDPNVKKSALSKIRVAHGRPQ